jgi:hypothetical protein
MGQIGVAKQGQGPQLRCEWVQVRGLPLFVWHAAVRDVDPAATRAAQLGNGRTTTANNSASFLRAAI